MLKRKIYSLITILIVFSLFTCIDPYTPKLTGYESVLVVEGMLTDERIPSEIKLSRSIQSRDSVPEMISDAVIKISDESGIITTFNSRGNGIYESDTTSFSGEVGKTYTLHIYMSNGDEYISDPATMHPVAEIDTIYYQKDEELDVNQNEILEGIRVFIRTDDTGDNDSYFRWEVEETWKYKLPSPIKYNYVSESLIVEVDTVKEECWRTQISQEIHTKASFAGEPANVTEPLLFIASSNSDRLLIRMSILVKQYSISRKEYDFWNNLRKVNETGGDIFDSQPYAVASNIKNITDPEEKVLGYFKVSSVRQKRIYINSGDLDVFDLKEYRYDCVQIAKSPSDYPKPSPFALPLTWDQLEDMYASDPRYVFVEPLYAPGTFTLLKLVFAKVECSECEVAGTSKKPDFWTD